MYSVSTDFSIMEIIEQSVGDVERLNSSFEPLTLFRVIIVGLSYILFSSPQPPRPSILIRVQNSKTSLADGSISDRQKLVEKVYTYYVSVARIKELTFSSLWPT